MPHIGRRSFFICIFWRNLSYLHLSSTPLTFDCGVSTLFLSFVGFRFLILLWFALTAARNNNSRCDLAHTLSLASTVVFFNYKTFGSVAKTSLFALSKYSNFFAQKTKTKKNCLLFSKIFQKNFQPLRRWGTATATATAPFENCDCWLPDVVTVTLKSQRILRLRLRLSTEPHESLLTNEFESPPFDFPNSDRTTSCYAFNSAVKSPGELTALKLLQKKV